ncbi:Protein kinase domain [Rubrobacter radiotolerans]|uniref:non-specific serine/threonine protein kinase n=1 Tax=Rubrobacter radiotolerans TaxID=42256 RepID=A0A023X5R0_RUBRA|nr:protein kinase [Rubrobacter radiotolerans]AHY47812.1 Protein kinase domain [Rubrobacter radiotolerans]MDX5892451.1 protein kinase [Rubrobacter radiotolerans]SMC07742.1 serine/threonine protein kinase [Rubrobacter radiotolerans DSM 5868]
MSSRQQTTEGGRALEASVGTVLGGRYRVLRTLGSGGMAVVYKAEDSILGRTVALKTLHARYAEMPAFRRRFRQEARAMASLDHQNIVKVYDISHDGEVPFIVAECVSGRDVGSLLAERHGRLSEQTTRRIATQLLEGLAYAHRRGIIHRDIKPSNILMTPGGMVKVADFGIARIVEDEDSMEPGEVIGSARYMSPEQLRGKEATERSDIYSVGIVLYHLLAGRPPFSGDLESLARQQIRETPKPLRKVNKKVSPSMEAVIMKALEKNPEDRYPSATAMLDDLEEGYSARVAGGTKEVAKKSRRARVRLVALTSLAAVILGAGTAVGATGLGYVSPGGEGSSGGVERANVVSNAPAPEAPESAANENREARVVGEMVPVPEVSPYFDYSAEEILKNRGFDVRIVYEYREGYADRGVAWGTEPAAGELAPEGSVVTVYATPKDLFQPQISQ